MAFQAKSTFINLPVKDLQKTMDFFGKIGFEFNLQFTDDKATCMIINDTTYAMLLVEPYFQTFIKKELADAAKTCEVLVSLAADSREHVDEIVNKAFAAGAVPSSDPQDHGFMYQWGFQDINGHIWEVFHMADPSSNQA
ncbi:MAG: glyoxalase/bleomycin resistance/extradiol dioxygenase family protein [Paenibacillus macerans]|uniref:Glyoxalase-like domain protein n=1 Tax=Paenibacillus macerans TaxID=44252 RepID=A0A091A5N0_PAEMA|nr:VOC family protein [Paenibacillus macerans]KFN11556.1 glyoxalase-like domain protein [Paenibacillus macerans]MBS5913142.1 glyoxalase/bleomycin resistance/extradiol dioxygenase family protein [Paenibacillus macerans]MCY7559168.1 glyoxalase/bleomycin resistance/extradiol dioxygenase family protein [Paenibacillus macerans]MDU7474562.1 glyoxalase/bleomycin resistance/extradiol dioxygenase family protein [Paenibacillus macerans]MEC0141376.1 glyoxalase/bleomycin resistance/extradiol dioxygenase f